MPTRHSSRQFIACWRRGFRAHASVDPGEFTPRTSAMWLEIREGRIPRTEMTTRSADGRTRRRARARARGPYEERAAPPGGKAPAGEGRQPAGRARLHRRRWRPWACSDSAEHPNHCHRATPPHSGAPRRLRRSRTAPVPLDRPRGLRIPFPSSSRTSPPRLPRPRRSGAQSARRAQRGIGSGVSYGKSIRPPRARQPLGDEKPIRKRASRNDLAGKMPLWFVTLVSVP